MVIPPVRKGLPVSFEVGKEVEGALGAGAKESQGLEALEEVGACRAMNRRGRFDERRTAISGP